jgi:uncharacterized BrkB/YihY/UPF0761 family membrane protein
MKVARTILVMLLGIAVPLVLQLWDRRRLAPEQRERAWNFASWGSALYAFGPLSLLGWYWVTRRGWRRLYGLPAALLAIAAVVAVDALLAALVDR